MSRKQIVVASSAAWLLLCSCNANSDKLRHADIIFQHGSIITGENLPGAKPRRVEALAVLGGRILEAGTDTEIDAVRGARTAIVDLHGAFVMPGFIDAHVHLASAGQNKLNVDLTGVQSLSDMQEWIRTAAKNANRGAWLQGRGWDHTLWPTGKLPGRMDLDSVTPGHPAIFRRVDGHIAVANTAALEMAHVTRSTRDPDGGRIDRDDHGEATGILRETAVGLVEILIPPPTDADRRKALLLALTEAAQSGITSVQDNSGWSDFLALEELERAGELPVRVTEWLDFNTPVKTLESQRAHHPQNDPLLHTGMLKGFLDGSLGSRTAALMSPYTDDPSTSGIPQYTEQALRQMVAERVRAGFQIGLHAIGDQAVHMALDAFAFAEQQARQNHWPAPAEDGYRFRVEHAQVVSRQDFARFRDLNVIASMQPSHLLTDKRWAGARLGLERAETAYAWKKFLDVHAPLAFGTDYPVEPIAPFRGIYGAITRHNFLDEPAKENFPGTPLSMGEALAAYTNGAAYAEIAETQKGLLIPGYLADFVVLDRDLLRTAPVPSHILFTHVLRTVVGGRTVYEASEARGQN